MRVDAGGGLHEGDPRQLGGYRLRARLSSSPEGTVYAAVDSRGDPVEVVLLSEGAAGDGQARERFRAAVAGGRKGDGPRVLSSSTRASAAAWAAVAPGGGGAGALLETVSGGAGRVRSGAAPSLQPHWSARTAPASGRWFWPLPGGGGQAAAPRANRAVVVGMVLLLLLAVLLAVLLYFWLSLLSQQAGAQAEPSPSPSSSPSGSPSPSPSPSPSESGEGDGPSEGPTSSPSEDPSSDVPEAPLDDDDLSTLPQDPQTLT
ncbi:hypothetical protein [Nocardiopsis suaedae]|uniref:Serine/threonine protein kinase n=1 Tax=Nocardiopsis suaedae TaxID=3018444 RepID=A0ABT4TGY0_9ACTN|nr:hypothetical protein [Nocardiopsis suaedae]MDA2803910.1 hypothetical protein [Nocardiopsis suaedae]